MELLNPVHVMRGPKNKKMFLVAIFFPNLFPDLRKGILNLTQFRKTKTFSQIFFLIYFFNITVVNEKVNLLG